MAAYEISHDYEEDEIYDVQYAQLNDIIFMAHKNHPPKRLIRLAANSWTFTALPFTGGPFFTDNAVLSGSTTLLLTSATITPSGTAGSVTLSASANIFTVSGSTLGHKFTFWKIGATVTNATTGLDVQGYVQITAVTNPSTATATIIKTLSTGTAATTLWAQGSWSDVLGWPACVTFHEQRLFFARTNYQPQNVWGSQSFAYENFAVNTGQDDDALDLQLASTESNEIKWLVSGDALIAGTYGGEFIIQTGDGSPLTPATANVKKQSSWGSEAAQPKRIGNFFYYIQRFGRKLRELFYLWDLNSYKSIDKTIFSPHISGDGGFKISAYQQNPDTILWNVCSNGTIATLTREVDQEVAGWARQTTDGSYESIAVIPSRDELHDEVWVVVKREINGVTRRYIERFKSQIVPDRQDQCWYVHSGLNYDAFSTDLTPTGTTISLSATNGTSVVVTSSVAYFAADDVGQRIRAVSSGTTVGELRITAYTSSTVVVGTVVYPFSTSSYSTGTWGLSVTSISGLDHLEAKDVVVLADGGTDLPNKTVSSGSITLTNDAFYITAGLPYTQTLKTLPQEAASQRGTAQGKLQKVNQVGFKLNNSFTGFKVGGSLDRLNRVQFRSPGTLMGVAPSLYTGVIPNITFDDGYKYGSQIIVQNETPLPIEILSILQQIDTQDGR